MYSSKALIFLLSSSLLSKTTYGEAFDQEQCLIAISEEALTTEGCSESSFLAALDAAALPACGSDPSLVVAALLATIPDKGSTFESKVCNPAKADVAKTDFYSINPEQSNSPSWYKSFFDGDTYLSEHVDDDAGLRVKREGYYISDFKTNAADKSLVGFPSDLANLESCTIESVMCCWVQDRQANDNNGGCADNTYAENCKNENPGDNTNLCYVDLGLATHSHNMNGGLALFDKKTPNGREGATHCHGFAWTADQNDDISRYRGNNLFFVTMFDHMYSRGYSKNIPGAPMCGCINQMPVVTRADCTQVNVAETFTYVVTNGVFSSEVTDSNVEFQACQATQNNDLKSDWKKVNPTRKTTMDQYLVGNNASCGAAIDRRLEGFYNIKRNVTSA